MAARFLARLVPFAALLLAGCGNADEGTIKIAWIGEEESLFASGNRLSSGAQHLRGATQWGLVTLDPQGEVVPALAERWIITDDGLSFIFRLREQTWPDGSEMDSASVKRSLEQMIAGLDGTAFGLDLVPVTDIRAMAGRVIEIRLSAPVPDLLNLLAQPELALLSPDGGTGPMLLERSGPTARLTFRPPLARGLPDMPGWEEDVREIELVAARAGRAMALFDEGAVQLVLGGRIGQLPLVDTGPLSRGTVRLDPAIGLFGLRVRRARGLLEDAEGREALAMALDREALVARYNVGGWVPTTRVVSPGLPGDGGQVAERWADLELTQLRAQAAARVQAARGPSGSGNGPLTLSLSIGTAAGDDLLLRDLAAQFATIGVRLVRAESLAQADLQLVDEVARYGDARWFLNQFNCSLRRGLCSEDTDYLMEVAQETLDPRERAGLLAEAESALMGANVFIPIGAPLRWSLVRGSVTGYEANAYAVHPLPPMAEIPR